MLFLQKYIRNTLDQAYQVVSKTTDFESSES